MPRSDSSREIPRKTRRRFVDPPEYGARKFRCPRRWTRQGLFGLLAELPRLRFGFPFLRLARLRFGLLIEGLG